MPTTFDLLWHEVSPQKDGGNPPSRENLLAAQDALKEWGSRPLDESDVGNLNRLYDWASGIALPKSVFADVSEELSTEKRKTIEESRALSTLAVSVISQLASLLPIHKAANPSGVVTALASFTSGKDAWTTKEACTTATATLKDFRKSAYAESKSAFWSIIETILKDRIRPHFAKTKNPAITAAGRKNFNPIPLSRFDSSLLDPESKPWKVKDVYTTTVFAWVVSQYQSSDCDYVESHFPFLVPSILALIDDDSLIFKTTGCNLLTHLLRPIKDSKSTILHRTNLSSVFEDAIKPCLLSIPTITPENDSIQLLSAAYPALLAIMSIDYTNSPSLDRKAAKEAHLTRLSTTLRENLLASYHHISSTNTTSGTSFASFPYPRLSTVLLNWIATVIADMGTYSIIHLQDVIPAVYSTLNNPFGTAHPPLLLAAAGTARNIVLNSHQRLHRWRGELLAGICSCWLHILEEEAEIADRVSKKQSTPLDTIKRKELARLKKELRGVCYLLKFALQHPWEKDGSPEEAEAMANIAGEMQELVDADDALKELLIVQIDLNDAEFFGLDP